MSSKKICYKHKYPVGTRQHYRRIAAAVTAMKQQLNEPTNETAVLHNVSANTNKNLSQNTITLPQNIVNYMCISNRLVISEDIHNFDNSDTSNSSVDKIVDLETNLDVPNLAIQLKHWVVNRDVSDVAVTDLLRILSKYHSDILRILDCRTLLKTSTPIQIKNIENGGEFCYLGLLNNLKRIVSQSNGVVIENKLRISFNIDGLPLFKSSAVQLWPILGIVKNLHSSPFAIAIFCGSHKPAPLCQFFEQFIQELQMLLECSFNVNENQYTIEIDSFICDAPARAFIKCVKSHSGYSSCNKCTVSGTYINRSVVLRGTDAPKRTD